MTRRRLPPPPFSLFSFQDIITAVTGIIIFVTLILAIELVYSENVSPTRQTVAMITKLSAALDDVKSQLALSKDDLARDESTVLEIARILPSQLESELLQNQQRVERLENELQSLGQLRAQLTDQERNGASALSQTAAKQSDIESIQKQIDAVRDEFGKLKESNRLIYNPTLDSNRKPWLVDIQRGKILVAPAGEKAKPVAFTSTAERVRVHAFLKWSKTRDSAQDYFVLLVRPTEISTYDTLVVELRDLGFHIGIDLFGEEVTIIDPVKGAAF